MKKKEIFYYQIWQGFTGESEVVEKEALEDGRQQTFDLRRRNEGDPVLQVDTTKSDKLQSFKEVNLVELQPENI
jgi:hypothetical protein